MPTPGSSSLLLQNALLEFIDAGKTFGLPEVLRRHPKGPYRALTSSSMLISSSALSRRSSA